MNRRHILLLLLALSVLRPETAFADDGEDGGDDGGDSSGSGGDDSGGDDSGDDGGEDNEGSGSGGDDDGEPGDDNGGSGNDDHDSALRAVEADGTLTLEEFLPHFRRQVKGRVVDVSLAQRSGALLFIVTYVDPEGRVRRRRFDARTGNLVE